MGWRQKHKYMIEYVRPAEALASTGRFQSGLAVGKALNTFATKASRLCVSAHNRDQQKEII